MSSPALLRVEMRELQGPEGERGAVRGIRWGRVRRGLRAGQGWSLEGTLYLSLQAMNAGPTEGLRERQTSPPSSNMGTSLQADQEIL